jgi:hypothetical protein
VTVGVVTAAGAPAPVRGGPGGRALAPTDWSAALVAELQAPDGGRPDGELELTWAGDAARLWAGDRLHADSYWTGRVWHVPVTPELPATLRLEVLPRRVDAPVYFPPALRDTFGVEVTAVVHPAPAG